MLTDIVHFGGGELAAGGVCAAENVDAPVSYHGTMPAAPCMSFCCTPIQTFNMHASISSSEGKAQVLFLILIVKKGCNRAHAPADLCVCVCVCV